MNNGSQNKTINEDSDPKDILDYSNFDNGIIKSWFLSKKNGRLRMTFMFNCFTRTVPALSFLCSLSNDKLNKRER